MAYKSTFAVTIFKDCDVKEPLGFHPPNTTFEIRRTRDVKHDGSTLTFGLLENEQWALLSINHVHFAKDDSCPICLCDDCDVTLGCCGGVFHQGCLEHQIKARWPTKIVDFKYMDCPLCRAPMDAPPLAKLLQEHRNFEQKIAEMREEKNKEEPDNGKGEWAFFMCEKCDSPFCGGKVGCAEFEDLQNKTMICKSCEWQMGCEDHRCSEHGRDFAVYKCDSCCQVATWDCINNHYCQRCHNQAGSAKNYPCPGPGKCKLGICHPKNHQARHGTDYISSFVIGCMKCVCPQAEANHRYNNGLNPFDGPKKKGNREVISLFDYDSANKKKKEEEEVKRQEEEKLKFEKIKNAVRPKFLADIRKLNGKPQNKRPPQLPLDVVLKKKQRNSLEAQQPPQQPLDVILQKKLKAISDQERRVSLPIPKKQNRKREVSFQLTHDENQQGEPNAKVEAIISAPPPQPFVNLATLTPPLPGENPPAQNCVVEVKKEQRYFFGLFKRKVSIFK